MCNVSLSRIEHHRCCLHLAAFLVIDSRGGVRVVQRPVQIVPRGRLRPGRLVQVILVTVVRGIGRPRPVYRWLLLRILHVAEFLKPSVVRPVTTVVVVQVPADRADVVLLVVFDSLLGFEVTGIVEAQATSSGRAVGRRRVLHGRRSRQRFWRARFLLLGQRARSRRRSDLETNVRRFRFTNANYGVYAQRLRE